MEFLTSLDNYNIFYEVAKCGNITKASERLYISQPAVSQSIKKLEENLGVVLFIRNKKGIELTTVGKKVFDQIEISLKGIALAEKLIDDEKELISGELIVGAGSSIAREVLCKPIVQFMQEYPLINFRIVESVQAKMIEMLKKDELNFVLTQRTENINFPFMPIFDTEYCFVKSAKCKLEKFITITEGSYTYNLFEKFIKDNKLEYIQTMQVAGYKTALELVCLGVGVTLLPKYIVQEKLNNGELTEVYTKYELPKIQFGVYYNSNLIMPLGKKFLEYLKKIY